MLSQAENVEHDVAVQRPADNLAAAQLLGLAVPIEVVDLGIERYQYRVNVFVLNFNRKFQAHRQQF